MARHLWGTYVGNNRVLVLPQWTGKLYAFADDLSLTPVLLEEGAIEVPLTNYMLHDLKPGMTVVDVGANLGYFSVLAGFLVGSQGAVLAYEPNPEMHLLLHDNLAVNHLSRIVTVVPKAVADVEGEVAFHMSTRFRGNSSLMSHSARYRQEYQSDQFEQVTVPSISLDECPLVKQLATIDFTKIDVEGGELRVFQGMQRLIAENRVKTVAFEFNPSMLQSDVKPLFDLLKRYQAERGAAFHVMNLDGSPASMTLEKMFEEEFIETIIMKFAG